MRFVNSALTILVTLGVSVIPVFAQDVAPIPTETVPFTDLGVLLGNVLALLFFVAGLLAFIFIMIGGIQWIAAGGDKIAAAAARDRITAAIIGLVIVVAAFAITRILEAVFGIRIISGVKFPAATNIVGD